MKKSLRTTRILLALVIIGVIAGAAYAFTAGNTVPTSYAGDGTGTISGYTLSNIAYTVNSTTPTNLDQVAFTLDQSATTAKIKLQGNWYACSISGGTSVTCNTTVGTQATVGATATSLEALAVQ
jgi:hypothetical protein